VSHLSIKGKQQQQQHFALSLSHLFGVGRVMASSIEFGSIPHGSISLYTNVRSHLIK
jgi:hypothetical protein